MGDSDLTQVLFSAPGCHSVGAQRILLRLWPLLTLAVWRVIGSVAGLIKGVRRRHQRHSPPFPVSPFAAGGAALLPPLPTQIHRLIKLCEAQSQRSSNNAGPPAGRFLSSTAGHQRSSLIGYHIEHRQFRVGGEKNFFVGSGVIAAAGRRVGWR